MIIIGLTGSIGMGKSTVAKMMQERGVPVHDADAAVHKLLGEGGAAVGVVGQVFPDALVVDGQGMAQIDRQVLGRLVFNDRAAKKKLEELLHPIVRAQTDHFVSDHRRKGTPVITLDIPLLFETKGESRVDVTMVVSANAQEQEKRVLARPNMTREKFQRIVAGQMPDVQKRKLANYVLRTDQTLEQTARDLDKILLDIKESKKSLLG